MKHGATLVWGPEIVDKAILHSTREVDRESFSGLSFVLSSEWQQISVAITGVVSYNGVSRAIFTTHPIEKPYFIYQIGSSDPELAVQAAKTVMQDISGIDLNCGCPKPFSTHAGMGAALLTNPDLLCSILTALREAMPPHITVSAKIRLLPSQEDTLKLVERIVNTGVSALTVHCRTRNMRERDKAVIERLREIVEFVEGMGKGIAVVENGDCKDWEDAKRVREVTGAHSVMIARGAESNPSCFSPNPLKDVERNLVPAYLRLVCDLYGYNYFIHCLISCFFQSNYLQHHFSLTKFCAQQFKAPRVDVTKAQSLDLRQSLTQAKEYSDMKDVMGDTSGEEELQEIARAIEDNPPWEHRMILERENSPISEEEENPTITPEGTQNPEPPGFGAPFLPNDTGIFYNTIPLQDAPTPTPSGSSLLPST